MASETKIDLFDNPRPGRDYVISTEVPEFTSVCPVTGQPDFGTISIDYCPDKYCIELKSLKFYMQSFRNRGIYYESAANEILDYLVECCKPKWMKITASFTPRGGISTEVVCEYVSKTCNEQS
ncbi:NADPH-dependent 7-cyano-7-deazaguanine reductase [Sedimentisphaera cyanobacteriorum]|uniref:NADPH-dependent 7-cyano-7-deazaguanine reductase n=1 Tax=Sedimentisphaera cyanobacteriorum TaxID=1940790 RepID=A0A1Q2HQB2_9BACT|nr:preQ(1) synthase [Sedimentisphaera cyanobacteriorum]AQQ09649.1 NADPH-dependent 7-cyano-7-deazaguanine reductase [Sedimentisphaera cyanobacteriorum]